MTTAADMRKQFLMHEHPARNNGGPPCKHDSLFWYPAPHDERGWLCIDCGWAPGEEPGYSPEHDRDHLRTKAWCILHDLASAGLVSVSNSGHGESIADEATRIARDARTLDQESLVAIIARICAGDGKFWREQHESILAGRDNRDRCKCGKIAEAWCNGVSYCGARECDPFPPTDGGPF